MVFRGRDGGADLTLGGKKVQALPVDRHGDAAIDQGLQGGNPAIRPVSRGSGPGRGVPPVKGHQPAVNGRHEHPSGPSEVTWSMSRLSRPAPSTGCSDRLGASSTWIPRL